MTFPHFFFLSSHKLLRNENVYHGKRDFVPLEKVTKLSSSIEISTPLHVYNWASLEVSHFFERLIRILFSRHIYKRSFAREYLLMIDSMDDNKVIILNVAIHSKNHGRKLSSVVRMIKTNKKEVMQLNPMKELRRSF